MALAAVGSWSLYGGGVWGPWGLHGRGDPAVPGTCMAWVPCHVRPLATPKLDSPHVSHCVQWHILLCDIACLFVPVVSRWLIPKSYSELSKRQRNKQCFCVFSQSEHQWKPAYPLTDFSVLATWPHMSAEWIFPLCWKPCGKHSAGQGWS